MRLTSNKTRQITGPLTVPFLFFVIFAILLAGQYASKTGAILLNQDNSSTALIYISIGYSCLVFRGFIWIILLKYVRLSVAYPVQSFSFILITFLGIIVFKEILTIWKIIGMILIVAGVLSTTFSK
jgi:multidrug transporter EmrE-like cation transporter